LPSTADKDLLPNGIITPNSIRQVKSCLGPSDDDLLPSPEGISGLNTPGGMARSGLEAPRVIVHHRASE
jgi:hypothetical protein